MRKNFKRMLYMLLLFVVMFYIDENVYAESTVCNYVNSQNNQELQVTITPDGNGSATMNFDSGRTEGNKLNLDTSNSNYNLSVENFLDVQEKKIICLNEIYVKMYSRVKNNKNTTYYIFNAANFNGANAISFKLKDAQNNNQSYLTQSNSENGSGQTTPNNSIKKSCEYNVQNSSSPQREDIIGTIKINLYEDGTLEATSNKFTSINLDSNIAGSDFSNEQCPTLYVTGGCNGNNCAASVSKTGNPTQHNGGTSGSATGNANTLNPIEYTCQYKGMKNGEALKIEKRQNNWTVTYPSGESEEFRSNGSNIFPTRECDDIFFTAERGTIIAVVAGNRYTDTYVYQYCHEYSDLEQFCKGGICKISNAVCGNTNDINDDGGECPSEIRPAIVFIKRVVFNTLQIFVPILLILMGSIDMAKAVMANDDKALSEATSRFIRRIITAIIFFFITTIVAVVIGRIATAGINGSSNWQSCWNSISQN